MNILSSPMGDYATNCYIIQFKDFEIIIDSGVDSLPWIRENVKNPKALLLTHGHFDHIWDSYRVAEEFNLRIFIDESDKPLLQKDLLGRGQPALRAEFVEFLKHNSTIEIEGVKIQFHHLPGHTPGSSMIELNGVYFSGDTLFKGSIGRFDLPLSNYNDMISSLQKLLEFNYNYPVYCGHGSSTKIEYEQHSIKKWI